MTSSASCFKHWLYLIGAILLEVLGTSTMKLSQIECGICKPEFSYIIMLICIAFSYYLLAIAATRLPIGVAYAFWEGLGLVLITLISVFIIGEEMTITRFIALLTVLSGIILIHHGTSTTSKYTKNT